MRREKRSIRVILAAGGSGGHIFPAISLASELKKTGVDELFFVSSSGRLDRKLLEGKGRRCYFLSKNPMPLSFAPLKAAVFTFKALSDLIRSFFIVARIRPDVAVGFGGYSSGTIALASKLLGVPLIIHEQNIVPGRANIILSGIADRIAVSFRGADQHFGRRSGRIVFTGNPVRTEMLSADRESAAARLGISPDKKTVLVMGGSQGSSFLNRTLSGAALRVKEEKPDGVQFVHLAGRNDCERVRDTYEKGKIPGRVFSFLDRIDDAYAASDMAVSRSGAAALFELACYGKPMVLIPYPNPRNNQRHNAIYFSERGAAIYREERDIAPDALARDILDMLEDTPGMARMAEAARKLAFPGAAKALADEVMDLYKQKQSARMAANKRDLS
jgi:UDP-N-acetylglucosamine--N-acetylmuramyl-(pentapeptide) pyrophosphoryl-undecaprenol N-acetylglucosamine transferase